MVIRAVVETKTITKKSPIPTIGPVATNTTDKAAGKNIPNPLSPTRWRAPAMSAATPGSKSSKTIVLGGTPAATAPLIAYFTGLLGKGDPNCCSSRSFFKGSTVLGDSTVKSVRVSGVRVTRSITVDDAVAESNSVVADSIASCSSFVGIRDNAFLPVCAKTLCVRKRKHKNSKNDIKYLRMENTTETA